VRDEVERVGSVCEHPNADGLDSRRKGKGLGDTLKRGQEVSVDGGKGTLQLDQPLLPVCDGLPLLLVQLDDDGLLRRRPAQRLHGILLPLPKKVPLWYPTKRGDGEPAHALTN
jgi:hypothetical protein